MENFFEKLNRQKIKQLADTRSFQRGEDYFKSGRVRVVAEEKGSFSAKVRGSHNYRVEIKMKGKETEYSCDCPIGSEEVFCKHLVAAGLTWIEGDTGGKMQSDKTAQSKPQVTNSDVQDYLLSQNKEELVKILMAQATEDDRLQEQLFLKVAQKGQKGLDLATYRRAINDSVDTGGFVDYGAMWGYCQKINDVVDAVDELKESHPAEAVELAEYFIEKAEEGMNEVDDSNGELGAILSRLQEIHHAACQKAKPDSISLAKKLFAWELKTDYDTFYNAAQTYADVLGENGIAEYRRLAEKEWKRVPELRAGQNKSDESYENRFQITHIMETLAEVNGDIEALVAIKSRDLSGAYSYLKIAEIYKKAGQPDKALEWAEKGLKAFPLKIDSRLRDFLAEEYHHLKRHDEALSLMWAEFAENPYLGNYQKLKIHVDRVKQWPVWREKAIAFAREKISQDKKGGRRYSSVWETNHSLLVKIFLWEKDDDMAWKEAKAGDCGRSLWLELAKKREKTHPENALEVYQGLIEPTIDQKNNSAYEEAASYLKKIKEALLQLNRADEFPKYLESLRVRHKPKRNLIKLLDQKFIR